MDAIHAVVQVLRVIAAEAFERLRVNNDYDPLARDRLALRHIEAVLDDCEAVVLTLATFLQECLHRDVTLSWQQRDDLFFFVDLHDARVASEQRASRLFAARFGLAMVTESRSNVVGQRAKLLRDRLPGRTCLAQNLGTRHIECNCLLRNDEPACAPHVSGVMPHQYALVVDRHGTILFRAIPREFILCIPSLGTRIAGDDTTVELDADRRIAH